MPFKPPKLVINPPVFFTSAALLLLFLGFGVLATDTAADLLPRLLDAVATNFGWLFVLAAAFYVGLPFCLVLVALAWSLTRALRAETGR